MSTTTVFISSGGHPGAAAGGTQPAYRAWADALLHRSATKDAGVNAAATIVRTTAAIGRIEPDAFYSYPLTLDDSTLFAAVSSDRLDLYFPPTWSEDLVEYLSDRRFDKDLVEELILPCASPMTKVKTSKMIEVLDSTPSDLLNAVVEFHLNDIELYLDSLCALPARILGTKWEIIVPESITALD